MSFTDALLAEFDHEAATTLRFLERVPADALEYAPHEKSMTLGQLALHIATAPSVIADMAVPDVYDWGSGAVFDQPADTQQVLDAARTGFAHARARIAAFTDEQVRAEWTAERDGAPMFALPRASLLRMILMNHWLHHRGQLSVYLRLVGAEVPSAYGPTADEVPDMMQRAKS